MRGDSPGWTLRRARQRWVIDTAMNTDTTEVAWQYATGQRPAPAVAGRAIRGAVNSYDSRGKGATMARRVFRGGAWTWVSRPAARERYLAADRWDTKYGDVWPGEIVAEYTLGGASTPDAWHLVSDATPILVALEAQKTKAGWVLSLPGHDGSVTLPDPYWR